MPIPDDTFSTCPRLFWTSRLTESGTVRACGNIDFPTFDFLADPQADPQPDPVP